MSKSSKAVSKKSKKKVQIDFVEPQLARLHDQPPIGNEWVHEIKFDGYRTQARVTNNGVKLYTRSGLDWTAKYGVLAGEFAKLSSADALIDGEIVAVNSRGRSDFHTLQTALKSGKTDRLLYYAFDLLYNDGKDLRDEPLENRKQRLAKLVGTAGNSLTSKIFFSEHWETSGKKLLAESCRLDLEGIVSKRRDALYTSGRSDDWIKSKCGHNEEFVIGGYTPPKGSRTAFGALLLGAYEENGDLRYVGRVGTGFNDRSLRDILAKMKKADTKASPFSGQVPDSKAVHWLKPSLVAQIKFAEFTGDHIIRHGSFVDLREDKKAKDVKLQNADTAEELAASEQGSPKETFSPPAADSPKSSNSKTKREGEARESSKSRPKSKSRANSKAKVGSMRPDRAVAGVRISHPERAVFKVGRDSISKLELAEYYELVSKQMVTYLADRPLSLLRCPDGAGRACFFQKHLVSGKGSAIRDFKKSLKERPEKK